MGQFVKPTFTLLFLPMDSGFSPKDRFAAVGVMVTTETNGRVRSAWPDVPEQNREDGGKELTVDFRNLRLDFMTLGPAASAPSLFN